MRHETTDLRAKCREISERYLKSYHEAMDRLGLGRPDLEPKATEHVVPDMTDFIAKLLISGVAYEAGGDVYCAVRKCEGYGALSGRNLDVLQAGARVEPGEHPGPPGEPQAGAGKQDPLDFALWKAAKPDEPSWQSPWGAGRPGWHIECSTMSTKYLGDAFDIHGGGVDLVFPHHENEIAQARAAGKPFARGWVHNGLLTVDGEKMSKSLGNFITVGQALKDCSNNADVLKMFLLSGHYRSPLNYMKASVRASEQRYQSYDNLIKLADALKRLSPDIGQFVTPVAEVEELRQAFVSSLDDDLNTPQALSVLDQMRRLGSELHEQVQVHGPGQSLEDKQRTGRFLFMVNVLIEHGRVLGIFENLGITSPSKQINELFEQYKTARRAKEFKTSDTLRKKLSDQGFLVQDTGGTSILLPKR